MRGGVYRIPLTFNVFEVMAEAERPGSICVHVRASLDYIYECFELSTRERTGSHG